MHDSGETYSVGNVPPEERQQRRRKRADGTEGTSGQHLLLQANVESSRKRTAKTAALSTDNTSVKRIVYSPLQTELKKMREEEDVPEADFIQVISGAQKRNQRRVKEKNWLRRQNPEILTNRKSQYGGFHRA